MAERRGILGIDAGGTFTDLVFLAKDTLAIEASTKVPTRHGDLLGTIRAGIGDIVRKVDAGRIEDVHLASTLATNATVEGRMAPSGLLLIGYDPQDVDDALAEKRFGTSVVALAEGGHGIRGDELRPLDEGAVRRAGERFRAMSIASVAVSGFFSVRNPLHEIRAREILLEQEPSLSVTCGYELVSELDAFKRSTTAAVNAGLIPVIVELFSAVRDVLHSLGIEAPLSIVKGDGSLVSVEWAQRHPVETVVSGPAASAMGARFLGPGKRDGRKTWVIDIGGTTTDIICLDARGNPQMKNEGATIGGHSILIRTIDIRTFGLGGDSRVARDKDGKLRIGPRRVLPLATAAVRDPRVHEALEVMRSEFPIRREPVLYSLGEESAAPESAVEERVLKKLSAGYLSLPQLLDAESREIRQTIRESLERLEKRNAVQISAFTPTDALLALGRMGEETRWSAETARLAAAIFAAACTGDGVSASGGGKAFAQRVCHLVAGRIAEEVFRKALSGVGFGADAEADLPLLRVALCPPSERRDISVDLRLGGNAVGVGAPAWAFVGDAAPLLGETAILPESAPVAGAVGAAVGTFFLRHVVLITPRESGCFRVHLPNGVQDFERLEAAVEASAAFMQPWLEDLARRAGGVEPVVEWRRHDEITDTNDIHLWTNLIFDVREKGEDSGQAA